MVLLIPAMPAPAAFRQSDPASRTTRDVPRRNPRGDQIRYRAVGEAGGKRERVHVTDQPDTTHRGTGILVERR